ncbi:hypothetical protein PIIN_07889 [Serendipita indica DSM 11827]|uniref:G-protein coupled receptors family 2 profile 2 domain-containing protein n=1 Tax=Serendipita indica (strain DSM 11827) TaxID=1109443 RepID=G4TRJ3_SERID|nr:hypothetical protein PIIN_07889 [Serendipita indica DSM 11827]
MLTLSSTERSWIWSNKVTLTKVLFLINRYSAPIVMLAEIIQFSGRVTLSDDICVIWLFFEALWQSLSALIVQFLLGLRMSAIWGSRPWTKFVLYGGCLVCAGASITSISVALAHVASTYVYSPQLRICYTTESLGPWLWGAFFLPIMLFDLLIFLLTIWHAALGRVEHRRKGSLTYMMWRDGAIYFALIFASELACVVVSAIWGFNKTMIFKFAVWTIQNVVISHMTLNLVEASQRPTKHEPERSSSFTTKWTSRFSKPLWIPHRVWVACRICELPTLTTHNPTERITESARDESYAVDADADVSNARHGRYMVATLY